MIVHSFWVFVAYHESFFSPFRFSAPSSLILCSVLRHYTHIHDFTSHLWAHDLQIYVLPQFLLRVMRPALKTIYSVYLQCEIQIRHPFATQIDQTEFAIFPWNPDPRSVFFPCSTTSMLLFSLSTYAPLLSTWRNTNLVLSMVCPKPLVDSLLLLVWILR